MKILISSSKASLEVALAAYTSTVAVEAEFGKEVVKGSVLTLAHHGPRAENPAPCLANNGIAGDPSKIEVIGVSHIDLDTLGGIMAVLGIKPESHDSFWELAAFIDVHGPHKLREAEASDEDIARLYAFWAWSQKNRVMAPRDGSPADITDTVMGAVNTVLAILANDSDLLAGGEIFHQEEEMLNRRSFVEIDGGDGGVIVRVADAFTNHIYGSPDGELAKAVVAFNTTTGAITISLADPISDVSAIEIVQSLWGPEAGGQTGIAGSPRGRRMTLANLANAFEAVIKAVA